MRQALSPKALAEAVGVSESSIRRWADGGQLAITRTSGGHRRIPLAEAVRFIRSSKVSIVRPDRLGLPQLKENQNAGRHNDWSDRFLALLLDGRAQAVSGLVFAMYLDGLDVAEICDGPLHNALTHIGDLWPQNQRSVFLEHRATMLCVRALNQLRLSLPEPTTDCPSALGGAPQDDPYVLPSLMASLVLHEAGYAETNLGPNTPLDVLADAVEDEQPTLVWLAVTSPLRSRQLAREITHLEQATSQYGGRLVMGGQSVSTYEGATIQTCENMQQLRDIAQHLKRQRRAE
ncbi:MerR family transcriptional regulator [Thalassoroseus pseudoceratinae]|uniref:MerR family transcriptional regulator n=1 Tax=Thalassoroseus pseudoceratinae TaxID=2713176 RepID=UPI001424048E|nr:MerR family DNA-binding transcriptional regulator [Thalassoroseus pseudoceratinae]